MLRSTISSGMDAVTLSVIIPCYNERNTVAAIVQAVRGIPVKTQIVCVDDASSDGTSDILYALMENGIIDQLKVHQTNQGKGAAIRTGISMVSGDIVAIQDADLEYDPNELPILMKPIVMGQADAVFGSRFRGGQPGRVLYFWHRIGNGFLTLLSNMTTNLNLTDMETCYKVIRTDLLKLLPLRSNRFGIEPEMTALLAQSGARIYEVGISYAGRTYEEGKKIGWRDGMSAIWCIIRFGMRASPVRGMAKQLPRHLGITQKPNL